MTYKHVSISEAYSSIYSKPARRGSDDTLTAQYAQKRDENMKKRQDAKKIAEDAESVYYILNALKEMGVTESGLQALTEATGPLKPGETTQQALKRMYGHDAKANAEARAKAKSQNQPQPQHPMKQKPTSMANAVAGPRKYMGGTMTD